MTCSRSTKDISAIDLGKFRLAVIAQIFIAEAAGDLIVAIDAAHHQHLLEELRRLRQRVELTGIHSARHEIVPRAFRRALGQNRSFHFKETFRIQKSSDGLHDVMAELKQPLHLWTAKIQVTVFQPDRLRHFGIVFDHEGRRLRLIQNLDGIHEDFDLAGGQIGILRLFRTGHNLARHRHDTFAPQGVGGLMHRRITLGIKHHLRDPGSIPQIDEHHHAMVAPPLDPAVQDDGLPDAAFVSSPHR